MISWERKSNEFLMPLWKWDVISDLLREAAGRRDSEEVCESVWVCVTLPIQLQISTPESLWSRFKIIQCELYAT